MVVGEEEEDDRNRNRNRRSKICSVIASPTSFIAKSLLSKLLRLPQFTVRIADSVLDKSSISKAIQGSSVVFYFDDDDCTDSDDFHRSYLAIVQGAKNVVEACRECKIRRLIYNSYADVVFDGFRHIINADESLPYAYKFENSLNELKAQAEAIILSANCIDGLLTCAIRPCNVFGPGDSHLLPFIVGFARSNWTKLIIRSCASISDFTYVDNVSHALICAEESLDLRPASVAGKAFFISNLSPMKFWDFTSLILQGLGYQSSPAIKLPVRMVWLIVLVIKWMHKKLGFLRWNHSAFHYLQVALYSRTFNCSAAQKHIGYSPVVPLMEGVSLTVRSFSHLSKDRSFSTYCNRAEPSKAEKLLGPGNVANVLLWRDEKKSFTCFLVFVAIFNWFFLSGRTFTSSVARLVLLVACLLFGYGALPSNIFGYPIKKISSSFFEIPDLAVEDSVIEFARNWNRGYYSIKSLAEQQDWTIFFKITSFLYFLKFVLSHSLSTIIGIALIFSFTAFFVYEQYESEIDGLADILFEGFKELIRLLKRNLPHSMAAVLYNNGVLHEDDNNNKPWT